MLAVVALQSSSSYLLPMVWLSFEVTHQQRACVYVCVCVCGRWSQALRQQEAPSIDFSNFSHTQGQDVMSVRV